MPRCHQTFHETQDFVVGQLFDLGWVLRSVSNESETSSAPGAHKRLDHGEGKTMRIIWDPMENETL